MVVGGLPNKRKKSNTNSSDNIDGATNLPPPVNSSKVLYQSTMPDILKKKDEDNVDNLSAKFSG